MKKMIKKIIKIIGTILAIIIIMLLAFMIYHKIMLKVESEDLSHIPGTLVEVNGHKVHVYTEGEGERTLVFMAGYGSTCPYIEFKPLYSRLSDKYKIVVIEKAGYGYSEPTNISRDLDTMLNETRTALQKAEITGKLVLVPHSMSGAEAIYWSQKYPDEIDSIVAIDISTTDYYDQMRPYVSEKQNIVDELLVLATRIGLTRFPFVYNALPHDNLSEEEWKIQKEMFFRNSLNEAVINEGGINMFNYSQVIKENPLSTNIPIYIFISSQMQENYIPYGIDWKQTLVDFANKFNNSKYEYLESSHMIHCDEPEYLAEQIKLFVK